MSEVQLEEDQDIYETIRAGITEGGSSFEMARHVLDALSDDGYIITRPNATGDKIMTDQYRKDLDALHSDQRLVGGKYDYQCGFLDALNSAKQAITEPIINDAGLAEAVKSQYWIMGTAIYRPFHSPTKPSEAVLICRCETVEQAHAIREEIINHAVKGEKVAEVTIKKHLSDDDYAALVASVRKHLELGMDFGGDPMEQIVFLVHRCLVEHGTIKIIDGEK